LESRESLEAKGFVELTRGQPKAYRARVLEEVMDMVKRGKQKEIRELGEHRNRLYEILGSAQNIESGALTCGLELVSARASSGSGEYTMLASSLNAFRIV